MYRSQGFTFVEMLIAIVILAIALSTLTSSLSTSIVQGTAPIIEAKAQSLMQGYLDEILPLNFDDQTPQGGGEVALAQSPCTISNEGQSRNQFDDVDDYGGINDQPPVLLQSGFDTTQYTDFAVTINVECAGLELGLSENHLVKRITVSVTSSNSLQRRMSAYRGNF
ncbi:type II secretion system protein [Oceaniserpentilla sp. 4NH20-0058]|uniref:prepilin-type N-terminal cleavage/methylation domain-containing protein n=1 Tax=Oceaniserpentilla sp. 4NH20-0058 TaxID=3127660 RepID=UPI003104CEE8